MAVLTGLAVLYFGGAGRDPAEGGRVSNGVIVLAVLAALLVWQVTKPGDTSAK
ncbi:amidophosphoribosyltransferase [Micromonospora sp. WMMD882]|uniref:amidophosphoribosyltransferase n=1 Tax=Micromonospora sp. WMMD882 TaxID=3015151 RepID=UPI00248C391D|nr:amidophosphoribosyltransferase [Micromonospora sp. WMMD882]WBB82285.1 amidophosphoribosyltransferase [Micromonospora sp. WMMD882]